MIEPKFILKQIFEEKILDFSDESNSVFVSFVDFHDELRDKIEDGIYDRDYDIKYPSYYGDPVLLSTSIVDLEISDNHVNIITDLSFSQAKEKNGTLQIAFNKSGELDYFVIEARP